MEKVLNTCLVVNTDSSEGQRAMEIFREQYNKAGLTEGAAWILNNHPVFAEYLRMGISLFSKERPEYFLVRPALEADFITPEEINKAYPDVVYADAQIAHLVRSLPSIGELKWRKQFGYAVMPAPPKAMSLLDIRANNVNDFYSRSGGWYAGRRFASDDETSPGWLAIKKTPVVNSFNREWDSQKRLLLPSERIPNVAEMSWFITTYFAVRGVRLFQDVFVRTSSLESDRGPVHVGLFASKGLRVNYSGAQICDGDIGLSAAWNL
jgi:hypothetical protein